MFYLFLAKGFEEIEAIATVDILRRADIPVLTVSIDEKIIEGAHGIKIEADISIDEVEPDKLEGIILPGGMPGTTNLEADTKLSALIDFAAENDLWLFAICAAPLILGKKGLLDGKKATCYPGFESYLEGAEIGKRVCLDNKTITGQGPGAVFDFAFTIIDSLGKDAETLKKEMQYA